MAQISTKDLDVIAVQNAMAESSEVTSPEMIAMSVLIIFALLFVIVITVIVYNMNQVRESKISNDGVAMIIKRILFAVLFFILTTLLMGVFYAF